MTTQHKPQKLFRLCNITLYFIKERKSHLKRDFPLEAKRGPYE